MKFLSLLMICCLPVFAQVKINVKLTTFDSFEIKSTKIKGFIKKAKGDLYIAKNITVPVKSLDSGMELRNKHIYERLGKDPVTIIAAKGRAGKGISKLKINGVTQKVPFKYKIKGDKAQIDMVVNLPKFKIKDIRYMGIGVEDDVTITAMLPVK